MLQLTRKLDVQSNHSRDMKKAAFRVFAALAANDEDLRKRIIDTDRLMTGIVSALNAGTGHGPDAVGNAKLQMAAVSCLHSLSRSVQLLRTSFQVNYNRLIFRQIRLISSRFFDGLVNKNPLAYIMYVLYVKKAQFCSKETQYLGINKPHTLLPRII